MANSVQTFELPPNVSRLLALGDPHGALEATHAVFKRELDGRTQACCVGDVVGYADGPASSALAEFLSENGVPTVEGNHEDWVRPGGTLAIVDGRVASKQLTQSTVAWLETLPAAVEFLRPGGVRRVALMIHSIREPRWDWISSENAPSLVEKLGCPRVLITGHSHRPKFIVIRPGYGTYTELFDFENQAELAIDIPTNGTVLVDTGSLGRAELEPSLAEKCLQTRRGRYGTYAVIDFDQGTATLRRHEHNRSRP